MLPPPNGLPEDGPDLRYMEDSRREAAHALYELYGLAFRDYHRQTAPLAQFRSAERCFLVEALLAAQGVSLR